MIRVTRHRHQQTAAMDNAAFKVVESTKTEQSEHLSSPVHGQIRLFLETRPIQVLEPATNKPPVSIEQLIQSKKYKPDQNAASHRVFFCAHLIACNNGKI